MSNYLDKFGENKQVIFTRIYLEGKTGIGANAAAAAAAANPCASSCLHAAFADTICVRCDVDV